MYYNTIHKTQFVTVMWNNKKCVAEWQKLYFLCVLVLCTHAGEYDVCGVTLSVHPTPGKLKSLPGHGGNRTRNLWETSPMLYQLR